VRGNRRLLDILNAAAGGTFPAEDASVEVLPPPAGPADAVVGFTAHHVIAAPVDPHEVESLLDPDDLAAPLRPAFLFWLGSRLGAEPGSLDVVLAAVGQPTARHAVLRELTNTQHPRVQRATRYRTDVAAYADPDGRGVVVVGTGLDGRAEVSVEVDPDDRGSRLGSALVRAARGLVPEGEPLYAQVAAANASSLRAFLAAGFRPIGAEVLFLRRDA
jgi:GNAT superfamily N-acetyltransferase